AVRLDVGVEVILAVVVGDLVAGLDIPDRLDADAAVADHRVGVAAAGMVGGARDGRAGPGVPGPARIHLVPGAIVGGLVALVVRQQRAGVLDDESALANGLGRDHAEACARAADAKRIMVAVGVTVGLAVRHRGGFLGARFGRAHAGVKTADCDFGF